MLRSRPPAWSAYLATKSTNISIITTFHGTYGTENLLKKYNSVMLKGTMLLLSQSLLKHILKKSIIKKTNIFVIPRGMDDKIFSPEK